MSKRALITGVAGQDGTYLTELLVGKGYEVFGVVGPDAPQGLGIAFDSHLFHAVEADLRDADSLRAAMREAQPDEVYNLAGISSVGDSWREAIAVANVNGVGAIRMLEALRECAPTARYCQASSAEIFGRPTSAPQDESTPIAPVSPYGNSKAFAHFATKTYREAHGIHASNAILYNHESPLRATRFVTGKIARGVAAIALGIESELVLGNLDVRRDWGFVGDYVRAMWLMLQQDAPDDYVVATGVAHSVRELCDVAFRHVGLDYAEFVRVDPALFRPSEAEVLMGDASKARSVLGWQPTVSFEETVVMMVDNAMATLRAEEH